MCSFHTLSGASNPPFSHCNNQSHIAKLCFPCIALKHAGEIGDLDKVKQFVKVMAFVNCVDGFSAQPKVVNGCSDLLGQVFGDKGKHARSAVGTNALPLNVPVEIEVIVEVEK